MLATDQPMVPKDVPEISDDWELEPSESQIHASPLDLEPVSDIRRLTTPWMHLIADLRSINVPACTKPALRCLQHRPLGRKRALVLYVDGGGQKMDVAASWAVTVLLATDCGWTLVGYAAGLVVTEALHPQYIGATTTGSGAAELSAEAWAAMVALSLDMQLPVIVRYDSITAAMLAQARASPRVHQRLSDVAAVLWCAVQMRCSVSWQHVAAHSLAPVNELTDSICWAAATNPTARLQQPVAAPRFIAANPCTLKLAYLLIVLVPMQSLYPAIDGDHLLPSVGQKWRLKATVLAQRIDTSVTLRPPCDDPADVVAIPIPTMVYNPMTLRRRGAWTAAARALKHFSVMVAGMCEARPFENGLATVKAGDEGECFFVVTSSATPAGLYGCALFIRAGQPWFKVRGQPVCVQSSHIAPILMEPRLLIVKVLIQYCAVLFVVAHGPHSQDTNLHPESYWHMVTARVRTFENGVDAVVMLTDANAQLTLVNGAVNDHSLSFQQCLESLALRDSTSECSAGPEPPTTFTSAAGTRVQNDYIAVGGFD